MPMPNEPAKLEARAEAVRLLAIEGGGDKGLSAAMRVVSGQFQVLQQRSQLLLTLSTLTITVTGFSGPRIAESGLFARYAIALGLTLVLITTITVLVGSLRIRWVTQFADSGDDGSEALAAAIAYRNAKTRIYMLELLLLVVGLTAYVSSVVAYLLTGIVKV